MIIATPEKFVQPEIQYVGAGKERLYVLCDDYRYEWMEGTTKRARTVRKGYETDLASVPALLGLSNFLGFSPYGSVEGAAALHDRGYQERGRFPLGEYEILINGVWTPSSSPWTRTECDKLFRHMCISGGADKAHADMMYVALRVGACKDGLAWYLS